MQLFLDKEKNVFTDPDYAQDPQDLEPFLIENSNANFYVDHEDFVASVPGLMTLGELDESLKDFKMVSNIQAPENYSISKILAEFHDIKLLQKILGLNMNHIDGFETLAGAKVIKNVSGYDMKKLYIGSLNSFAVITNAFIKLEKRFEKELVFRFKIENSLEALFYLRNFLQSFLDKRLVCKINYNKDLGDLSVLVKTTASDKVLSYRKKAMQDFLKTKMQISSLPQIDLIDFRPEYKKEQRLEFDFQFSDLDKILKISKEDISIEPLLGMATITDFQDLTELLPLIKNLKVFPVTYFSRKLLKDLAQENHEDVLVQKIKRVYDHEALLNPGVL